MLLMALLIATGGVIAQKKPAQKPQAGKKPPAKTQPAAKGSKETELQASSIPEDQVEAMRQQAGQLVNFFGSTLNFLADKKNPVKEKEVIINESYSKIFWDSEVQVEDDLDEIRLVPLYKDVQAYLSDVDFFFRGAKFLYTVQDASIQTNDKGQTFIRVTANRNLKGQTVSGDSINTNKVRYFEINYEDSKKQLKIVSIYTTKLNEREDMRNWWNNLSQGWHELLGKDQPVGGGFTLAQVTSFNDTAAIIDGQKQMIDPVQFYTKLTAIMTMKEMNLSGDASIADLEPLGKLSELLVLNLSETPVADLLPLRNLNKLESLDISGTPVTSLDPLRYCSRIKTLRLAATQIADIGLVAGFPSLTELDISRTPVTDLAPLKDLASLKTLKLAGTGVADLSPLSSLVNLEVLDISGTKVTDLSPLKEMKKLTLLMADGSKVASMEPLLDLAALQKVFCDGCDIPRSEAVAFMKTHPGTTVIVASGELTGWWEGMSPEWQKVFSLYQEMDTPPTKEQLHRLLLIDSINVNGRQQILTLNPVVELAGLRTIQFSGTGVTDVMPLKPLTRLTYVNAGNTQISDIGPMRTLKSLESVNLDNTLVADLDPLSGFDGLKIIFADNSKVTLQEANDFLDANPTTLVIFQTYENNAWWKALGQGWKDILLQQLSLKGTPDKLQLQQIANLDKLAIIDNTALTDLTPLQYLSRLRDVEFSGTAVANLLPLSKMTRLQTLRCSRNPIIDITPVSALISLKELDISNTQVEDLTPLQGLTQLEVLRFSITPVKKLKPLAGLTNLKVLEFFNTKISAMDELEGMHKLESLKIFSTKISEKRVEKFKQTHPGCEVVYY